MLSADRKGKITGTMVREIMRAPRSSWSKIWERSLTDQQWRKPATDWGHEHEPAAAAEFWARHPEYDEVRCLGDGELVEWRDPRHELWGFAAGSPDRVLVRGDAIVAGLEIKCPFKQENHILFAMMRDIPEVHEWQTRWYMELCGVPYWWFASYDPRLGSLAEVRVVRDHAKHKAMIDRVIDFKRYVCGES